MMGPKKEFANGVSRRAVTDDIARLGFGHPERLLNHRHGH